MILVRLSRRRNPVRVSVYAKGSGVAGPIDHQPTGGVPMTLRIVPALGLVALLAVGCSSPTAPRYPEPPPDPNDPRPPNDPGFSIDEQGVIRIADRLA
jgi:hypothetical protein